MVELFYAKLYDVSNDIELYYEFSDLSSRNEFLLWTQKYLKKIQENWRDDCSILIDEPASPKYVSEIPKEVNPFRVEDELDPYNWFNVFDDDDVYVANAYLEELSENYLELNSMDA